MSISEIALELRNNKEIKHHNCAQCILMSAKKYTNFDDNTAFKIADNFGGGLKTGEVCGCITGAVMALGLCGKGKEDTKLLIDDFNNKFGSIYCRDLKPIYGDTCVTLIEYEANKLEEVINNGTL